MPWEWWVSRLCEEFRCLPSEALAEVNRLPVGTLQQILEYRAFADAWERVTRNDPKDDMPDTPIYRMAREIEFALAEEDLGGG